MMKVEELGYAPEEVLEKAYEYAEKIARGDKVEAVIPIRWEDGALGFEISILEKTGMLNVTRCLLSEISE